MKPSIKYKIRKVFEAYEKERIAGSSVDEYYDVLCAIMKRVFGATWKEVFEWKEANTLSRPSTIETF